MAYSKSCNPEFYPRIYHNIEYCSHNPGLLSVVSSWSPLFRCISPWCHLPMLDVSVRLNYVMKQEHPTVVDNIVDCQQLNYVYVKCIFCWLNPTLLDPFGGYNLFILNVNVPFWCSGKKVWTRPPRAVTHGKRSSFELWNPTVALWCVRCFDPELDRGCRGFLCFAGALLIFMVKWCSVKSF